MKILGKLTVLGAMLLSLGISKENYSVVNAVDTTIEDMKKYDENIVLGDPYFKNGDFNNGFNSSLMLRTGSNYDGLYRGVTSCNEKESDIYALYDKRADNMFVRMGNFNGGGAVRTRMSSYYYDNKLGVPSNLKKTDYFNVSFSYRLYASEIEKMSLTGKDVVFRWQSRGSANTKSCDVLYKDLIVNEPGDLTWHTYTYRVNCTYSMTTDYGWFFFYYHDFAPKQSPTYYADIDNFSVYLDDGINLVKQNGDFEFLNPGGAYLKSSTENEDELYPNFYYRADYGDSVYQDINNGQSYLRMNANSNKSTFTYEMNRDLRHDQVVYINFDYKNLSYYEEPNLELMVDGKSGIVYKDILDKEIFSDNYISYVKDVDDKWKNQSIYLTLPAGHVDTLDFLLEYGGDLAIDNLVIADFVSIDYTAGNYSEFKAIYDSFIETVGDLNKYTKTSLNAISTAVGAGKLITEYSSQTKMDKVIELINYALANLEEKGDLNKIYDYIDQIFDEMAGTNKNDYDLRLYIKFKYALEAAIALDENSTKEEVDKAYDNLKEAYENMTRKESE